MSLNYLFLFLLPVSLAAQDSLSYNLSEVKVAASISSSELKSAARNVTVIDRKEIAKAPVQTVSGVLQYALNVDVRTRSPYGVQADVSIRGGHFDQTLVLLDGIKMNDPQTGHHSMNLPISLDMIERIEVLQGGASRVFGPSAFSGVINIVTRKQMDSNVLVDLAAGQHGLRNVGVVGAFKGLKVSANVLQSDGYTYNTAFDRKTLYGNWFFAKKNDVLRIQGGVLLNHFGASNFYHPKFNDQYEETNAAFLAGTWQRQISKKLESTLNFVYRKHNDLYDFNNYLQDANTLRLVNFHQTDVYNADYKLKYNWLAGISSFGFEYRSEGILSNRLGKEKLNPKPVKGYETEYYSYGLIRNNFSAYLEHQNRWNSFLISAGTLLNFNSQFGTEWYPGVDISWFPAAGQTVYASVNRSMRFPTFTEMYLNSSTVKADPNILPEKAVNYELGYKWFKKQWNLGATIFYKQTKDAIDKIKRPDQEVPTMENIDNINMAGAEWNSSWSPLKKENAVVQIDRVMLNYAALVADRKEDGFQSFYTLNYLKHKLTGGLSLLLYTNFSLSFYYSYRDRAGAYQWDAVTVPEPYKPVHLIDIRADYRLRKIGFYLDIRNLGNYRYEDFGFVVQPGRWISGGVKVSL
jgi:vitamin B12 transporter